MLRSVKCLLVSVAFYTKLSQVMFGAEETSRHHDEDEDDDISPLDLS